jgi:hypothetical protein
MAFDGDLVLGILRQPAGLALEHGALVGLDVAAVGAEEDAVADIGAQVFLAARANHAGIGITGAGGCGGFGVGGTGREQGCGGESHQELRGGH